MSRPRAAVDVSQLPTHAFGPANPMWWGTQAFMVIEGLGFAFAFATYLYFYNQNPQWPLSDPPGLRWSTWILGLLVVSEIPNVWLKRAAARKDLAKVRWGLIAMSAVGVLAIAFRWLELGTLHVSWDDNAYGSIAWYLLGYHTVHLLTDVTETVVMTVLAHIGPVDLRRFPEVEDNQDYWHFVVFFWAVTYVILYWFPRWTQVPS
jgi:heme/copper-type cytochrome/quinol oxidase subunit 3